MRPINFITKLYQSKELRYNSIDVPKQGYRRGKKKSYQSNIRNTFCLQGFLNFLPFISSFLFPYIKWPTSISNKGLWLYRTLRYQMFSVILILNCNALSSKYMISCLKCVRLKITNKALKDLNTCIFDSAVPKNTVIKSIRLSLHICVYKQYTDKGWSKVGVWLSFA